MAKARRGHDEEAWTNVKKICRLGARQVEMARALGMNPRKLPGLRPGPKQRWKLPVGEFIEECYWKQFGGRSRDGATLHDSERSAGKRTTPERYADASEGMRDAEAQLSDLACYLTNLADDLRKRLVHGSIDPKLLPQVRAELAAVVAALAARGPIAEVPEIPLPPRPAPSRRRGFLDRTQVDDEIPF